MRRAPAAAEALKTHAQAISDVTSKLAAEEIMEGDAAKTLLMLLGPQVELVIASAVFLFCLVMLLIPIILVEVAILKIRVNSEI